MVEPHSTRPTTAGINTAAVATLFQVMKGTSPVLVPEHYIILRAENIVGHMSTDKFIRNLPPKDPSCDEIKHSRLKKLKRPTLENRGWDTLRVSCDLR